MSPNVLRKLRAVDDAQRARDMPSASTETIIRPEGWGGLKRPPIMVGHETASS